MLLLPPIVPIIDISIELLPTVVVDGIEIECVVLIHVLPERLGFVLPLAYSYVLVRAHVDGIGLRVTRQDPPLPTLAPLDAVAAQCLTPLDAVAARCLLMPAFIMTDLFILNTVHPLFHILTLVWLHLADDVDDGAALPSMQMQMQ